MFLKFIYKFLFINIEFNEDNKIKCLCVNLKVRNLMLIIKKYYIVLILWIYVCDYWNFFRFLIVFLNMFDILVVLFEYFNVNFIFVY